MRYPVGVMADSLRLPLYASLLKAKELGAEAVQLSAVSGEFTYENYASTDVGRMELRGLLSRLGLRISAVCGDLGGRGFMIPEEKLCGTPSQVFTMIFKTRSSIFSSGFTKIWIYSVSSSLLRHAAFTATRSL